MSLLTFASAVAKEGMGMADVEAIFGREKGEDRLQVGQSCMQIITVGRKQNLEISTWLMGGKRVWHLWRVERKVVMLSADNSHDYILGPRQLVNAAEISSTRQKKNILSPP